MHLFDHTALHIFTDGSSFDMPVRGGVGIRYVVLDHHGRTVNTCDVAPVGYELGTPGQMEIQAAAVALSLLRAPMPPVDLGQFRHISLITDYSTLAEGYRTYRRSVGDELFRDGPEGTPVPHARSWMALMRAVRAVRKPVEIHWVRGNDAGPHHEAAHHLARRSANGQLLPPLEPLEIEDAWELR